MFLLLLLLCLAIKCEVRWCFCLNLTLQMSQLKGLLFSWTASLCFIKWSLRLKSVWHISHENCFFFVLIAEVLFEDLISIKILEGDWVLWGLFFWCLAMICSDKVSLHIKVSLQSSQRKWCPVSKGWKLFWIAFSASSHNDILMNCGDGNPLSSKSSFASSSEGIPVVSFLFLERFNDDILMTSNLSFDSSNEGIPVVSFLLIDSSSDDISVTCEDILDVIFCLQQTLSFWFWVEILTDWFERIDSSD